MSRTLALAAAAAAVAACSGGRAEERDAGPDTSRTYEVGAFSKIRVAGPYDVAITTGGTPMAAASGSARLLDKTEVLVEGDTLVIRPKKQKGIGWPWGRHGKVNFTVSTAMLNGAALAGSGDIKVDRVEGDFSGKIAGSGGIEVGAINGGNAELEIAGSGSARAAGTADQVTAKIAGSGEIDAAGLAAKVATVKIAGSGAVRAQASDSAAVNIAGSGDVEISGGAKCTVKKAGSGDVRCS